MSVDIDSIYDKNGTLKYTLEAEERNKTLPPGEYEMKVDGADGLKLFTREFTILKGACIPARRIGMDADLAAIRCWWTLNRFKHVHSQRHEKPPPIRELMDHH